MSTRNEEAAWWLRRADEVQTGIDALGGEAPDLAAAMREHKAVCEQQAAEWAKPVRVAGLGRALERLMLGLPPGADGA